MADQFVANIEKGVDDTALESALQGYVEQAVALKEDVTQRLAQLEITGVPEWLLTEQAPLDADFMTTTLEPSERILSTGERFGISAGAGAAAGVATKHLTGTVTNRFASAVSERLESKAVEKEFFKKFVSKVAGIVGGRAAGTAVGGAVGTIAGPLGTAVGAVAGTAIGVGVDYGMLKFDEWRNRESYREEIVQTIEDERAEMLAAVQGEQTQ